MKNKQSIRSALVLIIAVLFLSMGASAYAALSAVGPTDPANGFPTFYQDTNGTALVPCLVENAADPVNNPFCSLLTDCGVGQVPPACFDPAQPVVFPANFPSEFFYWIADSDPINVGPSLTAKAILRVALEGTFLARPFGVGDGITFLRINLKKMSGLSPSSTYTVTHPFGSFNFETDAAGNTVTGLAGQAFRTEDGCGGAPCAFTQLLPAPTTGVGPFLKAVSPAPAAGFIGNPAITQTVTPGPNGNIFKIDGPNIGGPGINTIQTNLWALAGQIFSGVLPTPLFVDRTTYNRATGGAVEIFAKSATTGVVKVSGGPNLPVTPVTLTKDANGNFYKRIQLADASTLPPTVTITATNTGNTATAVSSPLIDIVEIKEASYETSSQTLTITATSSDQSPTNPPTLTAEGYGPLVNGTLAVPLVTIPPAFVTVTSSAGGFETEPVEINPLSISGKVTKGGVGLAGVTVTLSGPHPGVTLTDINGLYKFPNLGNGNYTVTPSLTNFGFNPVSKPVTLSGLSVTNANFTTVGFSITGTIRTAAKVAMPGVTVTLSGATSATTTTNATGVYTFKILPDNSTFTITPSNGVNVFTPVSRTVSTAGANISGQSFTGN
jgi:hypothetical protein